MPWANLQSWYMEVLSMSLKGPSYGKEQRGLARDFCEMQALWFYTGNGNMLGRGKLFDKTIIPPHLYTHQNYEVYLFISLLAINFKWCLLTKWSYWRNYGLTFITFVLEPYGLLICGACAAFRRSCTSEWRRKETDSMFISLTLDFLQIH